jgi:hypothetical protein
LSAGQWDRRGTCSTLADSQIHKAAGIGVSRKNISTKITKRFVPRNPQAPSRNRGSGSGCSRQRRNKKYGPELRLTNWRIWPWTAGKKRSNGAHEIWEQEDRPAGREQEHWDQAVQEIEAEGSETERGPVLPDPTVAADSNSLKR